MFNTEVIDVGNFCLPIVHVTSFRSSEYLQCTKNQIRRRRRRRKKKKKKKKKKSHFSIHVFFRRKKPHKLSFSMMAVAQKS